VLKHFNRKLQLEFTTALYGIIASVRSVNRARLNPVRQVVHRSTVLHYLPLNTARSMLHKKHKNVNKEVKKKGRKKQTNEERKDGLNL